MRVGLCMCVIITTTVFKYFSVYFFVLLNFVSKLLPKKLYSYHRFTCMQFKIFYFSHFLFYLVVVIEKALFVPLKELQLFLILPRVPSELGLILHTCALGIRLSTGMLDCMEILDVDIMGTNFALAGFTATCIGAKHTLGGKIASR